MSLRDAFFKGASRPSRARVEMNAFRLRLQAPLRDSPRLGHFFLGESKHAFPFLGGTTEETAMKDLNSVQLIGRLGQDPNVQYTDHGTACTVC